MYSKLRERKKAFIALWFSGKLSQDGWKFRWVPNLDGFISSWEGGHSRKMGQHVQWPGDGRGNGVRRVRSGERPALPG